MARKEGSHYGGPTFKTKNKKNMFKRFNKFIELTPVVVKNGTVGRYSFIGGLLNNCFESSGQFTTGGGIQPLKCCNVHISELSIVIVKSS